MANRKTFRAWDQRLKDAHREPIEFDLDGTLIHVDPPTGKVLKDINDASKKEDGEVDDVIKALFGDEQGQLILDACEDAPWDVLTGLVNDVMEEFGLRDPEGK